MDHLAIARSLRRSAIRTRVLLELAKHGRAYPGLLAEAANVSRRDLERAMNGRLPYFSPRFSPLALGLARRTGRRPERAYVITPAGRRVAKQVRILRGRR